MFPSGAVVVVNAPAPLPTTSPVRVVAPVPPLETGSGDDRARELAERAPTLVAPAVTVPVKVGFAVGAPPRAERAAEEVVCPVPPLAIGSGRARPSRLRIAVAVSEASNEKAKELHPCSDKAPAAALFRPRIR